LDTFDIISKVQRPTKTAHQLFSSRLPSNKYKINFIDSIPMSTRKRLATFSLNLLSILYIKLILTITDYSKAP